MLGFKFSYLYRLHSESLMGLNAVCLPGGNPPGAVYRSSLPATPVSTPIRESSKFSEQALRDRLCRTPSPRKTFFLESRPSVPDIGLTGIGLNCFEQSWPLSPAEGEKQFPSTSATEDASLAPTVEETPSFSSDTMEMEDSESSLVESLKSKNEAKSSKNRIVYVSNLNYKMGKKQIRKFFEKFGKVKEVIVIDDHIKRKRLGYGFIKFEEESGAKKALQALPEELEFASRVLRVCPATKNRSCKFKVEFKNALEQKKPESYVAQASPHSMNINDLSPEVLDFIFSFLSIQDRLRMERVCKKWQAILLRRWKLERTLDFNAMDYSIKHDLTTAKLQAFLKRCGENLRTINLNIGSSMLKLNYQALEIIGQCCPKLEELDLTGVQSTNTSLRILAAMCPLLKKVVMADNHEITEKGVWWVFHSCHYLKSIDLSNNRRITGQCFHMAGPTLEEVRLNGCCRIGLPGFTKLATKCLNLNALYIEDCELLSDRIVELLVQNLKSLKTLSIGGIVPNLTSQGLYRLNKLSNLENLYLTHNFAVSDDVIEQISHGCEKLRLLDISGCHTKITDAVFPYLLIFDHLTSLFLDYLYNITNAGLATIAGKGKLEHLQVRNCMEITNEGLLLVLRDCPNLKVLDACACNSLTPDLIQAVENEMELREGQHLTLNVGGCRNIDMLNYQSRTSNLTVSLINYCKRHVCADYYYSQDDETEDYDMEASASWECEENDEYVDLSSSYTPVTLSEFLEHDDPAWYEELS